ncbi:helix-turn-helix domain-containing protein [Flavobacterium rhizosphaerae]|uniref:Helix-turn-helix domain-containing protein n=1 Tax=Flavobacterium rhizosphaerae TaxID=3163298 RepID=A0ABW8YYG4_9FLAO
MRNSEISTYNENRDEFKPYGLTCELWKPQFMGKPDRHNEIEVNYITQGSITYLFQGKKITVPAKRFTVFWGLVPHQIIYYEGELPYYVFTIPFSQFLEWKLPDAFLNRLLKGEILYEGSDEFAQYDEFLFKYWIKEIHNAKLADIALLEMRARLSRLSVSKSICCQSLHASSITEKEITPVEKMTVYIAKNYLNPIKISDIGRETGLHPDYANTIFKKAFNCTLNEYIIEERVNHAQRKLVTTDTSITEIAYDSGFNSISNFNAAFLKINNCTPRAFRKKYR